MNKQFLAGDRVRTTRLPAFPDSDGPFHKWKTVGLEGTIEKTYDRLIGSCLIIQWDNGESGVIAPEIFAEDGGVLEFIDPPHPVEETKAIRTLSAAIEQLAETDWQTFDTQQWDEKHTFRLGTREDTRGGGGLVKLFPASLRTAWGHILGILIVDPQFGASWPKVAVLRELGERGWFNCLVTSGSPLLPGDLTVMGVSNDLHLLKRRTDQTIP